MLKSIGFANKGFMVVISAAVLGLTGLGLFAPAAHAEPVQPTEGNKYCTLDTPTGKHAFDAGAKITIVEPGGQKSTYRCDGNTGKWVKEARLGSSGLSFNTFERASVTLGSGGTSLVGAAGTLSR